MRVYVGPRDVDPADWIRFERPGTGGRYIQVAQLAHLVADDDGWRRLCELLHSKDGTP